MDYNSLHLLQLPSKTRYVNITASGKGFVLVQVSYQYNLNVTGAWPLFTLDPQVDKNSNPNYLQLSVCSGYVCLLSHKLINFIIVEKRKKSAYSRYIYCHTKELFLNLFSNLN